MTNTVLVRDYDKDLGGWITWLGVLPKFSDVQAVVLFEQRYRYSPDRVRHTYGAGLILVGPIYGEDEAVAEKGNQCIG
jgi:hypothetical protein